MTLFFIIILSSIFSSTSLYLIIPVLRRFLLDQPVGRSSHIKPIPRGGGVVFVAVGLFCSSISFVFSYQLNYSLVILLSVPLSAIGLADDRFNLSSMWRYIAQLLTAVFILFNSPLVDFSFSSLPGDLIILFLLALLIIAITAVINFTNFMDGIDGLVAGCMSVIIATLAVELEVSYPLWALVGSLLGFLLLNWSPALVFMGDVGSTFLGAVFAGLVLQAPSWPVAFGFLLLATPLLADASICVIRRFLSGHSVFQAHRLHLFQRLHQSGWSHSRVSFTYISATVVLALALLLGGLSSLFILSFAVFLFGAWLDQQVAVPFSLASKN